MSLIEFIEARIEGADLIAQQGGDNSRNTELIQRAMSLETDAATFQFQGDLKLADRYRELAVKLKNIVNAGKKK